MSSEAKVFHVNPDSGDVSPCQAQIKCRWGSDTPHGATPELARKAYEESQAENTVPEIRRKMDALEKAGVTIKAPDLVHTNEWHGGNVMTAFRGNEDSPGMEKPALSVFGDRALREFIDSQQSGIYYPELIEKAEAELAARGGADGEKAAAHRALMLQDPEFASEKELETLLATSHPNNPMNSKWQAELDARRDGKTSVWSDKSLLAIRGFALDAAREGAPGANGELAKATAAARKRRLIPEAFENYKVNSEGSMVSPDGMTVQKRENAYMPYAVKLGYGQPNYYFTEDDAAAAAEFKAEKELVASYTPEKYTDYPRGVHGLVEEMMNLNRGKKESKEYVPSPLLDKIENGEWDRINADAKSLLSEYQGHNAFQTTTFDYKNDLRDRLEQYGGSYRDTHRNISFLKGLTILSEKMGSDAKTKAAQRNYPKADYPPLLDSDGMVISPSRLRSNNE